MFSYLGLVMCHIFKDRVKPVLKFGISFLEYIML